MIFTKKDFELYKMKSSSCKDPSVKKLQNVLKMYVH